MKFVPNILTSSRILLGLCLFLTVPLSAAYIGILALAASTDLLVLCVVISIAPVVSLNWVSLSLVAGIFVFKAVIIAYTVKKYGKSVFSHSYAHKLGATLCFTCPIPMLVFEPNLVAAVIASYMILTMFEELMISVKSPEPNPNFKGFLFEKMSKAESGENNG